MENEFEFRKDMSGYSTVQKCLAACTKQDYSAVTRQDYDVAIDAAAKAIAQENGVTYVEALTALMAGVEGRALYEGHEECPPAGSGGPVQKIELSKGEEMERAATSFSQAYNVPMAEARAGVNDYYRQ